MTVVHTWYQMPDYGVEIGVTTFKNKLGRYMDR